MDVVFLISCSSHFFMPHKRLPLVIIMQCYSAYTAFCKSTRFSVPFSCVSVLYQRVSASVDSVRQPDQSDIIISRTSITRTLCRFPLVFLSFFSVLERQKNTIWFEQWINGGKNLSNLCHCTISATAWFFSSVFISQTIKIVFNMF